MYEYSPSAVGAVPDIYLYLLPTAIRSSFSVRVDRLVSKSTPVTISPSLATNLCKYGAPGSAYIKVAHGIEPAVTVAVLGLPSLE